MSYDYGNTCAPRNATGPQSWAGVASSGDGVQLVSMTSTGNVYQSLDSGFTWTIVSSVTLYNPTVVFDHRACNEDFSAIWAASHVAVLWKSTDGGLTWSNSSSPDGGTSKNWSTLDVSANGSLVIASDYGGYLWVSFDGGNSWAAETGFASSLGNGLGNWVRYVFLFLLDVCFE